HTTKIGAVGPDGAGYGSARGRSAMSVPTAELVGPPTLCQATNWSLKSCERSAVLDAVQDASRRLRRCLTASWTASARDALPIGRSGRRNGRLRSNQGMRLQARSRLRGLAVWVIRRLPRERGAQGIEQTITDT